MFVYIYMCMHVTAYRLAGRGRAHPHTYTDTNTFQHTLIDTHMHVLACTRMYTHAIA